MKQTRPITGIERTINAIGSVPSLVIHTLLFIVAFALSVLRIIDWNTMLLGLTTIVSLEAIYLALFIQITVNRHTASLREVEEDIEELGEDLEDIQEDIEEISEDIDEIQEDVEEMTEEEKEEEARKSHLPHLPKLPRMLRPKKTDAELLEDLSKDVSRLLRDLEELKKGK